MTWIYIYIHLYSLCIVLPWIVNKVSSFFKLFRSQPFQVIHLGTNIPVMLLHHLWRWRRCIPWRYHPQGSVIRAVWLQFGSWIAKRCKTCHILFGQKQWQMSANVLSFSVYFLFTTFPCFCSTCFVNVCQTNKPKKLWRTSVQVSSVQGYKMLSIHCKTIWCQSMYRYDNIYIYIYICAQLDQTQQCFPMSIE